MTHATVVLEVWGWIPRFKMYGLSVYDVCVCGVCCDLQIFVVGFKCFVCCVKKYNKSI